MANNSSWPLTITFFSTQIFDRPTILKSVFGSNSIFKSAVRPRYRAHAHNNRGPIIAYEIADVILDTNSCLCSNTNIYVVLIPRQLSKFKCPFLLRSRGHAITPFLIRTRI